jgi:hypothetical protein
LEENGEPDKDVSWLHFDRTDMAGTTTGSPGKTSDQLRINRMGASEIATKR